MCCLYASSTSPTEQTSFRKRVRSIMGRSKYPSPKTSSSENGASALSNCHFASVPGTWWYAFSNCHSNGSSGSEIRTPRMLFPYMLHCTISSTSCLTQQLAKNFRSEEHTSEL